MWSPGAELCLGVGLRFVSPSDLSLPGRCGMPPVPLLWFLPLSQLCSFAGRSWPMMASCLGPNSCSLWENQRVIWPQIQKEGGLALIFWQQSQDRAL